MRRLPWCAVILVVALGTLPACGSESAGRELGALTYAGLGAWVDVHDYAPALQPAGDAPNVTPDAVEDMAALGVETLYLQAGFADERTPDDDVVDRGLVGEFLERAHDHDVAVVAWYLPLFGDLEVDMRIIEAMLEFEAGGAGFDSIAIDIEWTVDVPDHDERNARLVELSERTRDLARGRALGAIVFPPVQTEVVNPELWPDFPWAALAPIYDVWLPMAYWTFREGEYRNAYRYVDESVRRLRANLDDAGALVHAIGGLADGTTPADLADLHRAVDDGNLVGWSLYDYDVTPSWQWPRLRP